MAELREKLNQCLDTDHDKMATKIDQAYRDGDFSVMFVRIISVAESGFVEFWEMDRRSSLAMKGRAQVIFIKNN